MARPRAFDEEAVLRQAGARVTVVAPDGRVLGESHEDSRDMDNHLRRPEIQGASAAGQGSSIRFSNTLGAEMLYAAVRLEVEGETAGFVRLSTPLDQIETNIGRLQQAIIAAAAVTIVGVALLAFLAASRMDRLVKRLTDMAVRIAAGDLDARFYHQAPSGELGHLPRAFNDMADQLRQQVEDLTDQRGRLAAVLENMADGVLITDWLGQVTLINPAATRLMDLEEDAAIGRPFAELVRHHELIEMWQRSRDQQREMLATVEADREGAFIQMIVTPLDSPDRDDHLVILQDLTRIWRLETVRRDFISNVSP
ncbi:MAG: PAS domain-containing protein, partial [Pseudomonadota bacterium]